VASGVGGRPHLDEHLPSHAAAPRLTIFRFDRKRTKTLGRMMDGLMERKNLSQDGLNKGEALIAILLFSLCMWPVVWELASAVLRYL
jgi:hypothetical protein